ncbi:thioredoxin family protein [Granulicella paludicola]|uniref:thioredoxin family protein n=1 Tax=Granulicella paludicola TaxID=474951 RepID=UPI0021E05305|nr:thioredoxin family protein [Granulicella paludicola]
MKTPFRFQLAAFTLLLTCSAMMRAAKPSVDETSATAQQLMSAAELKASSEHKMLLVDFSASWCGNCKLFDRFWDDPWMHPILTRVFDRVTLDIQEHDAKHHDTPGADAVFQELGGSKRTGVPYLVMTSAKGKPIVTSEPDGKPEDGIGYPDAPNEIAWFMHMLQMAAPSLSPQETAQINAWLKAHSTHPS